MFATFSTIYNVVGIFSCMMPGNVHIGGLNVSKRCETITAISSDSRPPKFEMLDINNYF